MFILNPYMFSTVVGDVEDSITSAWFGRHTASPSSSFRTATDRMIKRLRSEGHLPFLTRLMLPVAETRQAALVDVLQPDKGGNIEGTILHKPKLGFQGDRSTGFVDLGDNCSSTTSGGGGLNNILQGGFVTEASASGSHTSPMGLIGQNPSTYRVGMTVSNERIVARVADTAASSIVRAANSGTHEGHFTSMRASSSQKIFFDANNARTAVNVTSAGISTTNTSLLAAANSFSDFTLGIAYHGLAVANGETFDTSRRTRLDACFGDYLREIGAIT